MEEISIKNVNLLSTSPPSLNLIWHLAAASKKPASEGLTLLRSWEGSPLKDKG